MANPNPLPPPVSPGRPAGGITRNTAISRAALRSASETLLNNGGPDPIQAAQVIARFLEGLSNKRLEAHKTAIAALPGDEFDRIVETLYKSANIQLRLADFVFPKPAKQPLPDDIRDNAEKAQQRSMSDLSKCLAERGLPGWVFGADAPVLDLEPAQPAKVTEETP